MDEIKESKAIIGKIDTLIAHFIGKEDKRQGITRNPELSVMKRIRDASWYSRSRPSGMTSTEKTLTKHAKKELDEAIKNTNLFFNKEWAYYQAIIEAIKYSPFKKIKSFKTN